MVAVPLALLASLALPRAQASDFMDVWVSTAFEDTNVLAGPEAYSPSINFVERGNKTFFQDYESRTTNDLTRANLVLYRRDEGYFKNWATEAAFVLRYTPYLDPSKTRPGVDIQDDGSYVRVIRKLPGDHQSLSLTGYAVDAGRWRLGYSYDLTWGGREIFSFDPGAAPGVRLQWQKGGSYAFIGAKTAIGDAIADPTTLQKYNQTYYGELAGGGIMLGKVLKAEIGLGSFQQGQILNVDASSPVYGQLITAAGVSGQLAWRSSEDLDFIESADLKLYRNAPDYVADTYIYHPRLEGTGVLVQAEVDHLWHNLLSATDQSSTTIEPATAGDLQTLVISGSTGIGIDLVYKDLSYILFNVPGLTSGVAMNPDMKKTAEVYGRFRAWHYFPKAHYTPGLGVGLMQPATYTTSEGSFVQYSDTDKEQVPQGQNPAAILSSVFGNQLDLSDSVVMVGEILYTLDNNQSRFVATDAHPEGIREPAPSNWRNMLGVNVILRARF